MLRDKADFVTLALFTGGACLMIAALFGWWLPPQAVMWLVVGGIGLVLFLSGRTHLDLNTREKWQQIEQAKQATTALYLANAERERKLEGVAPKQPPAPDFRRDWQEAAHRFMLWGLDYGFTIRALAMEHSPGKCVAWHDWRVLVDVLSGFGVLVDAGNRTRLADGWTRERWEQARHTLPYPPTPAPEVAIPLLGAVATPATAQQDAVGE